MSLASTTHSVNQILYFGTAVATPVSEGTGFTMNMPTEFAEDTSWGDVFKTYKPGLTDFSAQIMKHYDHNETVLRGAALAHTIGPFYWYPDRNVATDYLFWTGFVSFGNITAGALNQIISQQYDVRANTAPQWRP